MRLLRGVIALDGALGRVGKAEGLTCRSCALGFDDAVAAVQRVALGK